jgi:hypothetical protein
VVVGRGGDKAMVPSATRQIRPPRAGSGLHAPDAGMGRPDRGRRRLPRPAAPPRPATTYRGCISVEKGQRRDEGGSGGQGVESGGMREGEGEATQ